jgi:protein O-GlcNAc transferase
MPKTLNNDPTPLSWRAAYDFGRRLCIQENFPAAIEMFQAAIQLAPEAAEAYHDLGVTLHRIGCYDDALGCFESATMKNRGLASAWYNGGNTLCRLKRFEDAIKWYHRALDLNPGLSDARYNLANTYKQLGRNQDAVAQYSLVLEAHSNMPEAHNNMGTLLLAEMRFEEAMLSFEKAIALKPNHSQALYNAGLAHNHLGHIDRAFDYIEKCLKLQPEHGDALALLVSLLQQTCSWDALERVNGQLEKLTDRQLKAGQRTSESPFLSFRESSDTRRNFHIARAWSRWIQEKTQWEQHNFDFLGRRRHCQRLTIGYLSEHFRDAATAHLIAGIFARHDRSKFKIVAYSWGADDGSFYRRKIERDVDLFVDIRDLSDRQAAERIYADQVDILVDLMGWMRGHRMGVLARRPAPVQTHYLGYPATTGASFIDYFLADKIVIPPAQQQDYAEKIVYLPNCYQVTDCETPVEMAVYRRSDFDLPSHGFLFCSFNTDYKIDRTTFRSWMRILHAVGNSVLWLLVRSDAARNNLRHAAAGHGIDPDRLIFAFPLPKARHLARLKLADLALDTMAVNGHTTTSDALWSGVPVITRQGDHFASRVASSILHAIGLSELVTVNAESYENLAVALAKDGARLKELKLKLENNKAEYPLFKINDFVSNLESAYQSMWDLNRDRDRHPLLA